MSQSRDRAMRSLLMSRNNIAFCNFFILNVLEFILLGCIFSMSFLCFARFTSWTHHRYSILQHTVYMPGFTARLHFFWCNLACLHVHHSVRASCVLGPTLSRTPNLCVTWQRMAAGNVPYSAGIRWVHRPPFCQLISSAVVTPISVEIDLFL